MTKLRLLASINPEQREEICSVCRWRVTGYKHSADSSTREVWLKHKYLEEEALCGDEQEHISCSVCGPDESYEQFICSIMCIVLPIKYGARTQILSKWGWPASPASGPASTRAPPTVFWNFGVSRPATSGHLKNLRDVFLYPIYLFESHLNSPFSNSHLTMFKIRNMRHL